MKIIDHEMISRLNISPIMFYEWVDQIIKIKSEAILPAKTSLKLEKDGFMNVMPSIICSENLSGIKIVSRYTTRYPSLDSDIFLYEYDSGQLKAVIDGNAITAMRTGAVAVHSLNLLANPDFYTIAIIGLGSQARATFKILANVFPLKKLKIKLFIYKDHHIKFNDFIKSFDNFGNYIIEYVDTYDQLVIDSDVIISAVTFFDQDICNSDLFKPGCLIIPIHTRGFMNCDLTFDKVFVDDIDHIKGFKNYEIFKSKMHEVSEVVNHSCCGRESISERIIVYNIGISIHDIYIAGKIYSMFEKLPEYKYVKPSEDFIT